MFGGQPIVVQVFGLYSFKSPNVRETRGAKAIRSGFRKIRWNRTSGERKFDLEIAHQVPFLIRLS